MLQEAAQVLAGRGYLSATEIPVKLKRYSHEIERAKRFNHLGTAAGTGLWHCSLGRL
jgi:hypothetical protein